MKDFGEKIKELRKSKNLTQKELAEKIGQAQSTIVYWEQNKQEPTISALKNMCEFFEVSADYLLGLTEEY
ncbi:MAG: helix-turn-helix transcriptional regulator [Clostridia bacterium]|nr:helix-turn-helix transcriptional regulator [Clostridia bacterium]